MTRTDLLSALSHAERVRRASKVAFGREFFIETCLAIGALDETFLFEDVFELLEDAAAETHTKPPSESVVRKDLERLREGFGAIERLPLTKGERLRRETRKPSSLWALCAELSERARAR